MRKEQHVLYGIACDDNFMIIIVTNVNCTQLHRDESEQSPCANIYLYSIVQIHKVVTMIVIEFSVG